MNDKVSIAIVGVGAIGGAVAAALGDAGHEPALCVRTSFGQLSRSLDGVTRRYAHPVYTSPGGLSPMDWVLLCTKVHQIAGAATWLRALIGPGTRIGVMQNGIDHVERVSTFVDADRAVPCIISLPARVEEPGAIEQARPGIVRVPETDAARGLVDLFGDQGAVRVEPTADFVSAAWTKLVTNAVGGAICALMLRPMSALAVEEVHDLATGLMEEVVRVGRAEGASFADDFIEKTMENYRGPIGTHWPSIAVDRREGRSLEWEARNAVVGQMGRRHGIPTPLNDAMTALLSAIDASSR